MPLACDVCPSDFNPLQLDCNEDGVGDVCAGDDDGDGVPNDCDNCPFSHNPAQTVCSEDRPQLHPVSGLPMGLACSPTPCAQVDPILADTLGPRGFATEVRNDAIEGAGFVTHLAEETVRLGPDCEGTRRVQTLEGTGQILTGMRWCPCNTMLDTVDARNACQAMHGCVRNAVEYVVPADPTLQSWRPMTVDFTIPRPVGSPIGDEAIISYGPSPETAQTYADTDPRGSACEPENLFSAVDPESVPVGLAGRWRFEADAAAASVAVESRDRPPFTSERFLRSVNWVHSVRYESCATTGCRGEGGTDPASSRPLESRGAGSDEASHYWSGETVIRSFGRGREPDIDPYIPARIPFPEYCWYCSDAFPTLFFAHDRCGPGGCAPDWVARGVAADVPSNDLLTMGAHVALTQLDLSWVTARELRERLQPDASLMVGIDGRDQVIAQLEITDAGTLGLVEEKGDPLPPPVNPDPIAPPDVIFPQRISSGSASGRTASSDSASGDHGWMQGPCAPSGALFLLGNEHMLIGLGGRGQGSEHVAFTDLRTRGLRTIPIRGVQPGPVLAAAMHVARMEALVLDEHVEVRPPHGRGRWRRHYRRHYRRHHRPRRFLRFLRVDLRTGESVELARMPRRGRFDHYFMVGMADGRYALVASSERRRRAWVFALNVDGHGLVLSGRTRLRGHAVGAPVASRRGISLPFLARREETWAPIGIRPDDFRRCRLSHLRAAM